MNVITPGPKATWHPFALITCTTFDYKLAMERALSAASKKQKLGFKQSRPLPRLNKDDIPSNDRVKQAIIGYFNAALEKADKKGWMLSEAGIKQAMTSLNPTLVTSKRPFSVYWEFLEPTSNLAFLKFQWGKNPFAGFDFQNRIPNPVVRTAAAADKAYAVSHGRTWNGEAQAKWETLDKDSQSYW